MALLGVDTPLSNLMLLGWSLLQVVAGWLLLLLLFRRLGADISVVQVAGEEGEEEA